MSILTISLQATVQIREFLVLNLVVLKMRDHGNSLSQKKNAFFFGELEPENLRVRVKSRDEFKNSIHFVLRHLYRVEN